MFIKPLSYARVEDSEVVIEVACKSVCVVRACVQEINSPPLPGLATAGR